MKLQEITPATGSRVFHEVARGVRRRDPNLDRPAGYGRGSGLRPGKNGAFKQGEAIRRVLRGDAGRAAGRIAAFVDLEKAKRKDPAEGGIGFFECPDDPAAAAS